MYVSAAATVVANNSSESFPIPLNSPDSFAYKMFNFAVPSLTGTESLILESPSFSTVIFSAAGDVKAPIENLTAPNPGIVKSWSAVMNSSSSVVHVRTILSSFSFPPDAVPLIT